MLLCQTFHKIVVGMVNPLMGRFTYLVHMWNSNDATVVGTLEGVPGSDRDTIRTAHVTYGHNSARHLRAQLLRGMGPDLEIVASLAALQHRILEAKHIVIRWCDEQPPGTMCSMNAIFDLLMDNIHVDVPEEYYHTLRFLGYEAWDRKMLKCLVISDLYSNTRGAETGRRKVKE
jgi:hypothetical protein